MARINLLPWREAERKRKIREFIIYAVGGLTVALIIALLVHIQVENQIEYQGKRNDFLQTEIASLDKKIKEIQDLEKTKASLIARMNVIQQLQQSRPEIVHLFDEFVGTLPEGVVLTEIVQVGQELKVAGRAQSNARVSSYMRNIDSSPWIGKADLKKIEQQDKKKAGTDQVSEMNQFQLSARQITTAAVEPEAQVIKGAAGQKGGAKAPPVNKPKPAQ